jgi:hypothetical protein
MSTAARKARKVARREFALYPKVNTKTTHYSPGLLPFQHPRKTGTPVPDRQENQAVVHVHGGNGKQVNTVTVKGRRRLAEYEARTAAGTRGLPWPDHRRAARA